jgi:hypothetical protein
MPEHPLDVSAFVPVPLSTVLATAEQLVRVDRKYLVHRDQAGRLLTALARSHRVLEIDGRRSTSYLSTYFDTADLATCRAHLQRRRRRWKVRTRLYVEDGLCRVEVKTRDGSGTTAKHVADSDSVRYGRLVGSDAAFVTRTLLEHGHPVDAGALRPSLETSYTRLTLVDTEAGSRVTVDAAMVCRRGDGAVHLDPGHVLVETKGGARPGQPDRHLARLGARPLSFSKYASTASLLVDGLADNDVRRLRGQVLHLHRPAEMAAGS